MVAYKVYNFLSPRMQPVYQAITHQLTHTLGLTFELHPGENYEQLAEADFAFICGLPYVLRTPPHTSSALMTALAAPVLQGERFQNRPIYFSDVIVHRDNPAQQFTDLRGCSWAYNDLESQSGYGIVRYHLVRLGETQGFFGQVVEAGFHRESIRRVATREIDAAAIDVHVLANELHDFPELREQIRVIDTFGPSTSQPFVALSHIPANLAADVQVVLVQMHQADNLRAGHIDHFTAVTDAAYDDIRAMLHACIAADFLTLR